VQYKLLLYGIESSPLTTDSGIDLVAYSGKNQDAVTIQVKTNLKPKPGGGKGKLAIDWWIPVESPADLFALVDLEKNRVWLVKTFVMLERESIFLIYLEKAEGEKENTYLFKKRAVKAFKKIVTLFLLIIVIKLNLTKVFLLRKRTVNFRHT